VSTTEHAVVTRCARKLASESRHFGVIGNAAKWLRVFKPLGRRRARHNANQSLRGCVNYDELDLAAKRITCEHVDRL
jgi:hypothetical protein